MTNTRLLHYGRTAGASLALLTLLFAGGWGAAAPATAKQLASAAKADKGAKKTADAALRNIREAAARIKTAALEVVNDVDQRRMTDAPGDPLFFYPTEKQDDKDPQLWAKEISDLGSFDKLEQPRKEWLDSDIAHLGRWISSLNSDMSALSSNVADGMTPVVNDINANYKSLQGLDKGPKYDNLAIAKAAFAIHDDIAKLAQPWKDARKAAK